MKRIGSDAARTLRRNFNVDDMLKSSRGIDEAVDLIQRLRNICKVGGFKLTKFVINKIEMMKSIPEDHCRKNINIKELESTKGKSMKSGMEHQNRYIWIQDTTER